MYLLVIVKIKVARFYHSLTHSLTGTLDRPRVVAPSKTCGHVRSSRRRRRWAHVSSSICCIHVRQGHPRWRFHSGLMSGLPPVRASTARRSAEWAIVKNNVTLKLALRVVEGHWKWRPSKDHIRLTGTICHCNYSFILYCFRVIWGWIMSWPWNFG